MKKIKKLRTGPPPEKVGWTYFCTNLFDIIIKICHNCYMKLLKIDLEDAKPEDYTSTSLFFTKASEAEKIHYHNASRKQNYHNYRLTSYRLKKCAFTLAEVLITHTRDYRRGCRYDFTHINSKTSGKRTCCKSQENILRH